MGDFSQSPPKKVKLMKLHNIYINTFLLAACLLFSAVPGAATEKYASESVLASGKWVKIQVSESGLYQLSRTALAGWGFNDISKVKVFGYGGAMHSEILNSNSIDDLPQVPVYRSDSKIIFYAQGPVAWNEISGKVRYEQYHNPYADYGYYFVTDREDIDIATPKPTGEAAGSSDKLITTFPERIYHEKDLFAPGTTGRLLLGEDFKSTRSRNFPFKLTGLVEQTTPSVKVKFTAAPTQTSGTLTVSSDNSEVGKLTIAKSSGQYAIARSSSFTGTLQNAKESTTIGLTFSSSGSIAVAGLDCITINYARKLDLNDNSLNFRSYTTSCRDSVFSLANVTDDTRLWDITTAHCPQEVNFNKDGNTAYFRQTVSGKREYIAFKPSATFPSPTFTGNVTNQNIHGKETPTMLIITPAAFRSEAERLAELHRNNDGMKVEVLTDVAIYNEFSSGTPDAMAYRKVSKMWFDRSAQVSDYSNDKYRYLLLFGRSVFDNRRIAPSVKSLGYPTLLTWESPDSDSESSSYNTDDIFGFLEDGTNAGNSSQKTMNIGIGRIPVKSTDEAKSIVDKIYKYVNTPDMGAWKSRIMIIADDADGGIHMNDSDTTIDNMNEYGAGDYMIQRIYIDAYKTASSGAGHSYPEAREQMLRSFREGVIYANYLGHANPTSWTHNELLRWPDIVNEFYYKHSPLMYTGTCEFTRWDSPEVSGGEMLFLNEQGGVIGIITSSRVTGMSANGKLGACLGKYVFNPLPNGEMPRIGDLLKFAKNDKYYNTLVDKYGNETPINMEHSKKYALIGDPALRLKYPKNGVSISEINGIRLSEESMPEIQARGEVTMKGYVTDKNGQKIPDYNGLLTVSVYDAEVSVSTNGNADNGTSGAVVTFQEHSNKLYAGSDSIRNGEFTVKFRMPTSIINNYTPGLVNLYAQSDVSGDAFGKNEQFYVYGFDETETDDNEGPEIKTFVLNTESFANGDNVNETPYVIASFSDASGINLSSIDIGHGITLTLDNEKTITGLESFFTQDTEKNCSIYYQMDEIAAGSHTLRLRVWDVFGNMSEKEISFNVVKGLKPQLFKVYSTANPAKTSADFYIEHNRPDALLSVTIGVYNMLGEAVWTSTSTGRADMYTSMPVTWDLTDGSGRRVQRGIYIYRATVSADGGEESSINQRIAVAAE